MFAALTGRSGHSLAPHRPCHPINSLGRSHSRSCSLHSRAARATASHRIGRVIPSIRSAAVIPALVCCTHGPLGPQPLRLWSVRLFSHRKRPVHLGPYPLERLPRLDAADARRSVPLPGTGRLPARPAEAQSPGPRSAAPAYQLYLDLFDGQRHGDVAPVAPTPDDPATVTNNLKAGLYFLDADMVGCALIVDEAWTGERRGHRFVVVSLIAFTRKLSQKGPGDDWIDGTRQINADLRAAELAVITASYIRNLGYDATAHTPSRSDLDLDRVAWQAGLVEVRRGRLRAPYVQGGFALSAVSTDWELAPDLPLARRGPLTALRSTAGLGWLLGIGGTRAGIGRLNGDHRRLHMGRYPMERIKRADEPTTLIIEDEVPRVPVRAGGFPRAANGDMGPKFRADVKVFAWKTPQAPGIRASDRRHGPLPGRRGSTQRRSGPRRSGWQRRCPQGAGLPSRRRHGRGVPGADLRLVFASWRRLCGGALPRQCSGDPARSGLRDHGGCQRRRLGERRPVDAGLHAGRPDRWDRRRPHPFVGLLGPQPHQQRFRRVAHPAGAAMPGSAR